jgi:hypothetical protein
VQSAAVLQPQRPVTWESQPPPQVVDDGHPSCGLWQLSPAPPFTSVQPYMSQPAGQQAGGGWQVPGESETASIAQTSPDAHWQGFETWPSHGPPCFETHPSGTHPHCLGSKWSPAMHKTSCTQPASMGGQVVEH